MNTFGYILIALVVIALGWLALSKDPLATAIRVRFNWQKSQVANALDDANARIQSAIDKTQQKLAIANGSLVSVKQNRHDLEAQVNDAKRASDLHQTQANNAASVGRADLVTEALRLKDQADAQIALLQPQLDLVLAKEKELSDAIQILNNKNAEYLRQKSAFAVRGATATTVGQVDAMIAGLDQSGADDDAQRADQIIRQVEAKAGAFADMAQPVKDRARVEQELNDLAHPQDSVEARTAALMAKFGHGTAPAAPASN